jgi:predicted outer membrane repeat protein
MFIKAASLIVAIAILFPTTALAAPETYSDTVGTGTTASCTEARLNAVVAEANGANDAFRIYFNCGKIPYTIPLKKAISITNVAIFEGGGLITLDAQGLDRIFVTGVHSELFINDMTLTRGFSSGQGGAILVGLSSNLTLHRVTFTNNVSTDTGSCDGGGAIRFSGLGYAVIDSSTFTGNQAKNGGAINNLGNNLTITNSIFTNNSSIHTEGSKEDTCGGGGAVFVDGAYSYDSRQGIITIAGSTFTSNKTNMRGGAIFAHLYVTEQLLVTMSSFTQNYANFESKVNYPESGDGGGIWIDGENQTPGRNFASVVQISNSTFYKNHADYKGGAILAGDAPVQLTNLTLDSNEAQNTEPNVAAYAHGDGGGLFFGTTKSTTLSTITNVTITRNSAGYLGGAIAGDGANTPNLVQLVNTVIANNSSGIGIGTGKNCALEFLDLGGNVQFPAKITNRPDTNCTKSILIADPHVATAGDNGGSPLVSNGGKPLLTVALGSNSAAIDHAVASACPNRDQRGYMRSGACDSGAFEYNGQPFTPSHWAYMAAITR